MDEDATEIELCGGSVITHGDRAVLLVWEQSNQAERKLHKEDDVCLLTATQYPLSET